MFKRFKKPIVYLLATLLAIPASLLMSTAKPAEAATVNVTYTAADTIFNPVPTWNSYGSVKYTNGSQPGATATTDISAAVATHPGIYNIEVSWLLWDTQTSAAVYQVWDNGSLIFTSGSVDQKLKANGSAGVNGDDSGYLSLGNLPLSGNPAQIVLLGTSADNGNVVSDSVKISHANVLPTAPVLNSPANGNYINSAALTFSWSASTDSDDTASAPTYDLYVDGLPVIAGSSALSYTADISLLPEGLRTWSVASHDAEGFTLSLSRNFIIDRTDPVISPISPVAGTTGEVATVTVSATDVSPLTAVISFDAGATWSSMTGSGPFTYDYAVPSNSIAPIPFVIEVADPAGNFDSDSGVILVSDNDKPVINSNVATPDNTGEISLVSVNATDNIGVTSALININGAGFVPMLNPGPGIYTYPIMLPANHLDPVRYVVSFNDAAGNGPTTASKSIIPVDNDAPVIAAHANIGPIEATSSSGAVVIYTAPIATDNIDAPAPATCTLVSGATFPIGINTVTCSKTDAAGNNATPTTFQVTVQDTTAPVVDVIAPEDGLVSRNITQTFTATASEDANACFVDFSENDFEGSAANWTTSGNVAVVSSEYHSSGHSLQLQTTNDGVASDNYAYITAQLPSSGSMNLNAWIKQTTTDGFTWDQQKIYLTDASGNFISNLMYTLSNSDWHNVSYDLSAYAGQMVRIYFAVHDDGWDDPSRMWVDDVSVGGSAFTGSYAMSKDSEGVWSATVDNIVEGTSQYFIRCTDASANTGISEIRRLTIDVTAPQEPVATPGAGESQTSQSVTLSSADNVTTVPVIYYTLDGSVPNSGNSFLYDGSAIVISRDLTLKAIAYDEAGNASSVLTAAYDIAPVISQESASGITTTSVTITWTTNSPATSRVVYDTVSHASVGLPANYGYAYSTDTFAAKTTLHKVTILGLTAGTTYYFRTISEGSPVTIGNEVSFATAPEEPSVIVTAAQAEGPAGATTPNVVAPSTSGSTDTSGDDNGQIKGDETLSNSDEEQETNWTPWIILFILIILAGAATGGYFYCFAGDEEEEKSAKESKPKVVASKPKVGAKKPDTKNAAKKSKRW